MTELYSLITAAIASGIVLVSREVVVRLIQQHYSNLSKSQVTRSFYALLIVTFILSFVAVEFLSTTAVEEVPQEKVVEREKSDAEIIAGTVDTLLGFAMEKRERKKWEESMKMANRDKKWVYQIGTPMTKKEALQLCGQLQTLEGICLFKEGKKSYRVILFETNSTEEVLNANRSVLQENLKIAIDVKVVDLTSFCSIKEVLFQSESLEGEYSSVQCYECRKE